MKHGLRFFCILFSGLIMGADTSAQSLPYTWGKAESITYSVNPGYPRQVVAGHAGKVLWGVLQGIKLNYGQRSLGNYKLTIYDSAGNAGNQVSITGKMWLVDAQADAAGNWYVLGYYYDSVVFTNGMMLLRDPMLLTKSSYFMFRLDAGTLALSWLKPLGSNNYCKTECFTLKNNHIYLPVDSVSGSTINKIDITNGARTELWKQGDSYISSLQVDDAGNIYLTGACAAANMEFNNTPATVPAGFSYPEYVVRYKANGQHDWHFWMKEITCVQRKLSLVNNNFIYYSGTLYDSVNVNGYHFNRGPSMASDYLMVRMDSTGQVKWGRQLTGITSPQGMISILDPHHGVVKDSSFLFFATSRSTINWGNSVTTATVNLANNATLVSVQPDGASAWAKVVKARFSNSQHIVSDGNAVWITGVAMDSTAIGFDSLNVPVTPAYSPYLAKLEAKKIAPPPTGINNPGTLGFAVAPNPATNKLIISGLSEWNRDAIVLLVDITGRHLLRRTVTGAAMEQDVSQLSRGIYFLEVQQNGQRVVKKIVLE